MIHYLKKPFRFAILYALVLVIASSYVLLDTFVIPKSILAVSTSPDATDTSISAESTTATDEQTADTTQSDNAAITDTSYTDSKIQISIKKVRANDSDVYLADVQVTDASYLKTALAGNTYGRNIKDTTSEIAKESQAIFAINGDFYGFRDYGYVVRNGVVYRDTSGDTQDLVIDAEGNLSIINESEVSLSDLTNADTAISQVLSFGPALIEDGKIVVDSSSEVSRAMGSNPRTAIGQISALHYVFVVSDGRTEESAGLSLLELAQVLKDAGCTTAYNLDGGGSSTMYFNGTVVNNPTDGRNSGEREVSDIVYIGY